MSLIAKSEGSSNFIPVPTGMHLARCYRIIDLGTQKSEYMGNVKQLHKMMLQFEVHGEDAEGNPTVTAKGDPMTVSKNFTVTLAEKVVAALTDTELAAVFTVRYCPNSAI